MSHLPVEIQQANTTFNSYTPMLQTNPPLVCPATVFNLLLDVLHPGRYSTNFSTERLRPQVQPLTHLDTIFHEMGTFYLLLTNGTPFIYFV